MRRIVLVAAVVALGLGLAVPVSADDRRGPSGSSWDGGQVTCGHTETFLDAPVVLYNGYRGLEVCHESVGRAWIQSNRGEPIALPDYVHVDWDEDFALNGQVHVELPF